MAKITITIVDSPGGKVAVKVDPSYELMMKMTKAEQLTSAHGYALLALNAIREESKRRGPVNIKVPRIHLN